MVNRNARYAQLLIAAAGLLAAVPSGMTTASAQTTDGDKPRALTSAAASAQIERAADLLANGKAVQAKALLLPLADDAAAVSLSDSDRQRVFSLLASAGRRLKSLSPVDVSLQTAEAAFEQTNLRVAAQHATAVVNAPKSTNEQVKLAKSLLESIQARQAELAPEMNRVLDAAVIDLDGGRLADARMGLERVSQSGVELAKDRADLLAVYQSKVVDIERASAKTSTAAGMLQPGVVKPRPDQPATPPATQPSEPAPAAQPAAAAPAATPVQPEAAAPAPTEPAGDIIQQARRWEAAALLAEADLAFDQRRLNEAVAKYSRLSGEFKNYITADQLAAVTNRLAEARVLQGSGADATLLVDVNNTRQAAKQNTLAEFDNLMQRAASALASAEVELSRNLAAQAEVRLNNGRDLMSEGEYESLLKRQKDLVAEIIKEGDRIRIAETEQKARELADATQLAREDAQQTKARKISEAITRVRALQAEMKYEEAIQVTEQILFLDPINPTGLLLRDLLQDQLLFVKAGAIQREKTLSYAGQSVDNQEAIIAPTPIIKYPDNWPAKSYQRGAPSAFVDSEENRRTLGVLASKRVPAKFDENTLEDVFSFIQTVANVNMDVDWPSLEIAGIQKTQPVTLNLTNVPVKTILDRVMDKLSADSSGGAAYTINDGVLTIASKEQINKTTNLLIYDIRDLLIDIPDYDQAPEFDLQSVLQNSGQRGGGGGGQSPFRDNQGDQAQPRRTLQERTDDLLRIITTNVDSGSWQENGGTTGFIQPFQGNLIITQTPNNHRQIGGLLSKLREQRAMQINVETRFLLVNQNFFEQIGVDLDVYFNGRNNQVRTARQQNPAAQIQPSDFFDFGRGGLQRRVFGAPIDANGDGQADPQIGNVTQLPSPMSVVGAGQNSLGLTESLTSGSFANNILSRAPALGVAGQFLDDIQVDFLIKATQADTRTVTLTAPRLTFTNGQISNIYVATQVSFVSDLTPIVSESAVGFDPQLGVVNEGVRMLVEGTVSADRRYVTMNISASIAAIQRFNQIGITALAGGQLVNSASTQSFIQTPVTTVTSVSTTVTVPDQGTILLGGQRLVTEGEVETGVPVLSKIPILNRFFSNRTETKEESTLLILMKPTILIQNEEEERAFPGLSEAVRSPFGG